MKNQSEKIRPPQYEDNYEKLLKKEIREFFFNKKNSKYKKNLFETTNCPACGSRKRSHFNNINNFTIVKCNLCELVYVNPRPKLKMQNQFLEKCKAFDLYSKEVENTKSYRSNLIFNPLAKKVINQFGNKEKNLLEIGCGPGLFLKALQRNKAKYSLNGIDINNEAVRLCNKKGLNVNLGSFENFNFKKKFDIILFWAVFDHFNNPKKVLKKCYEILNKDGGILIGNLNMDGFESTILGKNNPGIFTMPARLNFFNIKSIETILKKTRFKNISTITSGKLDVDIVRQFWKSNNLNKNIFLEKIILGEDNLKKAFQEFLINNNLSSHMTTIAYKKD